MSSPKTGKHDSSLAAQLKRERSIVSEGGYAKSNIPCAVSYSKLATACHGDLHGTSQGGCLMTKSAGAELILSEVACGDSCPQLDSSVTEKNELSDSSSEASMKTALKANPVNNPPLKYNRAFR